MSSTRHTPRTFERTGQGSLAPRKTKAAGRWSRWLPTFRPGPMPHDVPETAVGGMTGVLVAITVIVLFGAAVTSHQLTPYAVFLP